LRAASATRAKGLFASEIAECLYVADAIIGRQRPLTWKRLSGRQATASLTHPVAI
jgi:hypothetical protein